MLPIHRITQGDAADFKIPLLLDGVSAPIDGWALETMVQALPEDADGEPVIHCTAGNGRVIAQWADAWLVRMPSAVTREIPVGRYFFKHVGTSPAGDPLVLEKGVFYVDPWR